MDRQSLLAQGGMSDHAPTCLHAQMANHISSRASLPPLTGLTTGIAQLLTNLADDAASRVYRAACWESWDPDGRRRLAFLTHEEREHLTKTVGEHPSHLTFLDLSEFDVLSEVKSYLSGSGDLKQPAQCEAPPPPPTAGDAVSDVAPSVAARNVPPTPKRLPPSAPPAPTQAQAASEAPLSVDGACRSSNPIPDLDSEPDPLIGEPNPYPHRGDVAAAASKALPQEAGLDA